EVRDNLLLQARLKHALSEAHGGLALYYQPQVDLVSGRLKGFEALLRWHDEVLGQVSPARLIPVAEGSGMIVPLGYWILEQACRQIRTWMTAGTPVRVAVNLSPRQFREQDLVERIRILLLSVDIPAHLLELEVTEGALMDDPDRATAMLSELAGLGICLSIDDFGTGYSSLSYLKQFPIHKLKIDQSFVRELPEDQNSASIVRSIIGLAHSMRLEVIAEGVETFDQLQFLRDAGCEEYQGYFFSRPVPATECTAMLSRADDPARLH
ncbi:MAG: EAL domain-containing protein, partial [Gammaproteobacteria bacterium]|nr:EAL domain-containing protein [Gammaproteobacteria bacterium]